MKSVLALLLAPLLALSLAACSGGGDTNAAAPAAPVAAKAAPAGQNWTEVVAKTDEGYRMGNPDAPIKLVEYGSRLCPACKGFADGGYEPLTKNYVATGKVSFEFREFMVHGIADVPPALLGRCVGTASFFPVMEQQYRDQAQFTEKLTPALMTRFEGQQPAQVIPALGEAMGLIGWFAQRGLPEAQARACLGDQKAVDALIKITQDRGADGTVSGTPTLIVNGNKVDGITWPDVEKALKQAGA